MVNAYWEVIVYKGGKASPVFLAPEWSVAVPCVVESGQRRCHGAFGEQARLPLGLDLHFCIFWGYGVWSEGVHAFEGPGHGGAVGSRVARSLGLPAACHCMHGVY